MTDQPLPVDPIDATDPVLRDLAVLAPVDPARIAPGWDLDRNRRRALHPHLAVLRRAGGLVAAAAVLAAVGAGLALALPPGTDSLSTAAACDQPPVGQGLPLWEAGPRVRATDGGLRSGTGATHQPHVLQAVTPDGQPLTRGVRSVTGEAVLGVGERCPGHRGDPMTGGTMVRLVQLDAAGVPRACLVTWVGSASVRPC